MNARQLIAGIRAGGPSLLRTKDEESLLLADLAEEGLASLRGIIECESLWIGAPNADSAYEGWWDTSGGLLDIRQAVDFLDRAGCIERKAGEPHLVRFVESP